MELFLFKDLLVILGFSIIILLIGHRLGIPPIVGFLLTGVLAGPHGLGLVRETDDVEKLAQMGIVLLLFGIGMEFSFKKLVQMKRLFLLGGLLQVGLTIALGGMIASLMGWSWQEALFAGCLLSMSSTAIVLSVLKQKLETITPHGQVAISILVFQDIIAIPMILLIPLLGSQEGSSTEATSLLLWSLVKGIAIMIAVFISAQKLVPYLLLLVARTRNKELFLLSVLTLCFGVAWLTSGLGLSLTIGAFLAGLLISESEYSHEAISHIFSFQALFISFFFVSVGMLLNLDFILPHLLTITGLSLFVIMIKFLTGGLTALCLGFPLRTAAMVGVALCQIGEFSFVLAKTGFSHDLIANDYYQFFVAVSLLTMAVSPILINLSPRFATWLTHFPLPEKWRTGLYDGSSIDKKSLKHHVIIVGFGVSGRNLARSSKQAGIPYTILEMNPDTVREQKNLGEPIHFGDAMHLSVLEHLNIQEAKALAILINDPVATRRIVKIAREVNPSLYIIVRTRYIHEIALMNDLGANEVIPDEFGTSVEIFSRVLRQYHIPDLEIDHCIKEMCTTGYELLRQSSPTSVKLSDVTLDLYNIELVSFRLKPGAPLIGKSLAESKLRQEGVTVLLIQRENEILFHPAPDTQLMINDILVVIGEKVSAQKAEDLFGFFPLTAQT